MNFRPRISPSGPKFTRPAQSVSYDAGSVLTLIALPAGHIPGLYNIVLSIFTRVFGAGNLNVTLTWDQPNFGPTSLNIGTASVASTRIFNTTSRPAQSSGLAPIALVLTPSAITVNPTIDTMIGAELIAASLV